MKANKMKYKVGDLVQVCSIAEIRKWRKGAGLWKVDPDQITALYVNKVGIVLKADYEDRGTDDNMKRKYHIEDVDVYLYEWELKFSITEKIRLL